MFLDALLDRVCIITLFTTEKDQGLGALMNLFFCVCIFKKFQALRKKKDKMKTMELPRIRKRRRRRKGVTDNTKKCSCYTMLAFVSMYFASSSRELINRSSCHCCM